MTQTPVFGKEVHLRRDIAILVLSAPLFLFSACDSSSGNSASGGCPAGQVLRYESSGCGTAATPVCGPSAQDACYRPVCSCQGQTISRCDYASEPFSAFGACPLPDTGVDLATDQINDKGIDVPVDLPADIAVLDLKIDYGSDLSIDGSIDGFADGPGDLALVDATGPGSGDDSGADGAGGSPGTNCRPAPPCPTGWFIYNDTICEWPLSSGICFPNKSSDGLCYQSCSTSTDCTNPAFPVCASILMYKGSDYGQPVGVCQGAQPVQACPNLYGG